MVIIEGCDNSGKSQLIMSLLQAMPNCSILKSPGPGNIETLGFWILTMIHLADLKPIIFDRFPVISEEIYGKTLRNINVLESWGDRVFWDLFKDSHPLIIYCRPPLAKILDFGTREQMEGVKEHVIELVDHYDYLMTNLRKEGLAILEYDFTGGVLDKEVISATIREYFSRSGFTV